MKNQEFINKYVNENINGIKHLNHLTRIDNKLYNYDTLLCIIDYDNKCALLNSKRYSVTTTKIQSLIAFELHMAGYTTTEEAFENDNFYGYWNMGYQGALLNNKAFHTGKNILW